MRIVGAAVVAVAIGVVLIAEACYWLGRARGLREAYDIVARTVRRRGS